MAQKKLTKLNNHWVTYLGVSLLIITAIVGFAIGTYHQKKADSLQRRETENTDTSATIPSDWKTYTNTRYNFSVSHPSEYHIECADQTNLCQGNAGAGESVAINFYPPQETGYARISVQVLDQSSDKKNINESLQQYVERIQGATWQLNTKTLQIDGHDAVQVVEGRKILRELYVHTC